MVNKKPNIKKQMNEARDVLLSLMQENLGAIAEGMVQTIVSRVAKSTPSQRLTAIKDVPTTGIAAYKQELLTALSVIAKDALDQARSEVPKAKNVKLAEEGDDSLQLGEFERLPAAIRNIVLGKSQLLVGTQIADLEKAIFFQFGNSVNSTDSMNTLTSDLNEAATDYVTGASVNAAANASAADTVNTVRNAFFLDDDVQEQLDAFEFVNGDPVSPICQDLAGTIFAADDPELNRYWPPLHWNCKSYINPILAGNLGKREIEKLAPSKTAQESIQFSEGKVRCNCGCHGA